MSGSFDFGGDIVWRPTPDYIETANMTRFMRQNGLASYDALMERSTSDVPWFTRELLEFLDIRFYHPYSQIVDLSRGPAWPSWCVGGKLNIVHNCLDKYIGTPTEEQPALIWEGEDGKTVTLTYGELHLLVNRAADDERARRARLLRRTALADEGLPDTA